MVAASSIAPVTANAAYKNSGHNNNNSRNHNRFGYRGNQPWQQQNNINSNSHGFGRGYQGRCQLCGVHGHSAQTCKQLHLSSGGYQPSNVGYPLSNAGYQPSPMQPWQPRANVAMVPPYNPANWIMDSSVTYHLTSDLANLSMHQPYTRGEEVTIADGSGLLISHSGSALLPTPSRSLVLKIYYKHIILARI